MKEEEVTYAGEIAKIQRWLRRDGYYFSDDEVELMWRRYSREFLAAGFGYAETNHIRQFMVYTGLSKPETGDEDDLWRELGRGW